MTIFKKGLDGLEVLVFVPGNERVGLPWDHEKPVVVVGPGISDPRYVSGNRQEFDPDTVVPLPEALTRNVGIYMSRAWFHPRAGRVWSRRFDSRPQGVDPAPQEVDAPPGGPVKPEGVLRLVLEPENEQAREFIQYFGGDGET